MSVQSIIELLAESERVLDAESVKCFAVEGPKQHLWCVAHSHNGEWVKADDDCVYGAGLTPCYSHDVGLAGMVAANGGIVNISEPYMHPNYHPRVDHCAKQDGSSMLCCPIRVGPASQIIGVMQVFNKKEMRWFAAEDEVWIEMMAGAPHAAQPTIQCAVGPPGSA